MVRSRSHKKRANSASKTKPIVVASSSVDSKDEVKFSKPRKLLSRRVIYFVGFGVVFVLVLFTFYFYSQYNNEYKKLQDLVGKAQGKELESVVAQVEKLIELPSNEPVTVASVTDVNKLSNQTFFARAQNGDKILIYSKSNKPGFSSNKAILYRPSKNKIIEVGQYQVNSAASETATLGVSTKQVTVAIYNGTSVTGLTKVAQKDLEGKVESIKVTIRENASFASYSGTLVVDLAGNKDKAEEIAKAVGGKVSALSAKETKPEADILIILGSSYNK